MSNGVRLVIIAVSLCLPLLLFWGVAHMVQALVAWLSEHRILAKFIAFTPTFLCPGLAIILYRQRKTALQAD